MKGMKGEKAVMEGLLILAVTLIAISFYLFFLGSAATTGMAVAAVGNTCEESLDLLLNESSEYVWKMSVPGELRSLMMSGTLTRGGRADVYIDHEGERYLVFGSPGPGETGMNVSFSYDNVTLDSVISFENICTETCALSGFNAGSYKFVFNVINGTLNLTTISYTLSNIFSNETNVSDILKNIAANNTTVVEAEYDEPEQLEAEINRPVRWVIRPGNRITPLPDHASNVSVIKQTGNLKEEVKAGDIRIAHKGRVKSLEEFEIDKRLEELQERLKRSENVSEIGMMIENVDSLRETKQGLVSGEAEDGNTAVLIDDDADSYEIFYETDPPEAAEEEITPYRKMIVISSAFNYTDVLAYTDIPESPRDSIKLYWYIDCIRTDVTRDERIDLKLVDSDGDNLVDRLQWTVPHLSNQTFEVDITILNVQSYPIVGGEWTVRFETSGRADLEIRSVNGTVWHNENEDGDLRFLELKCGEETLDYEWTGDSVLVEGYECNETGYETSRVLTSGKHDLQFRYGIQTAYAHNLAGYYTYDDVLVVANNASPASLNITGYFVTERNINYVVYLNLTTSETIDFSTFNGSIRNPVEEYITDNSLEDVINYIVTTKGVPLKISGTGEDCSGAKSATAASVDSELSLILGPYNISIGNAGLVSNPYHNQNERFNHSKYGIYLVTRLTGYQNDTDSDGIPDDVKNLIDSASSAVSSGNFVLDQDPDWEGITGLNGDLSSAHTALTGKGLNSTLNTNSTFLTDQQDVLGYASWGSNDHYDHLYTTNAKPNNTWANGSLAETYVSTSGRTFTYPPSYGQSLIADLISEGVTGAKGYVYEPCSSAMADVNVLFDRYTEGFSLADSYYMASSYLGWMDIIVGDPKAIAFKETSPPVITLDYPLNGSRINNGTFINFSAFDNEAVDSVWYSNGTGNITINPYSINTSGWVAGEYNMIVYANDTAGNMNSKSCSFIVNDTTGEYPEYMSFDGNTTDFKTLADRTNVVDAVLEKSGFGKIEFLENADFSALDLDQYVTISENFIEIDTDNLPGLNKSANLTIHDIDYLDPVIFRDGQVCPVSICTRLNYSNGILTFNVTQFTSYSAGPNSNLTIWDETDTGMPYADQTRYAGNQTKFFANYTNITSGEIITGAECNITFDDSSATMDYNSSGFYDYNRTFSGYGNYYYNITCNATGFENLTATDYVIITLLSACNPPGEGDWFVNETCNLYDEDYMVNGNLTIESNGFLNMTGNTNITFNGTSRYIFVRTGGEINMYDSAGFNK